MKSSFLSANKLQIKTFIPIILLVWFRKIAAVFQLEKEYHIELSLKQLIKNSSNAISLMKNLVWERRFLLNKKEIFMTKFM
jgi:hypothetical protein